MKKLLALPLCAILLATSGNAQKLSDNQVNLKVVNYQKSYKSTEHILISAENRSNKPLMVVIGIEAKWDADWIAFNPDIKNHNPLKDLPAKYELLPQHKVKTINVTLKEITGPNATRHGISRPLRFFLKYTRRSDISLVHARKIVSKEFFETW